MEASFYMDSLLIDFSQAYGQNKTRKVYGDYDRYNVNAPKAYLKGEVPKLSFEDILSQSVKQVNNLQLDADKKIRDLAIGDVDDISEVVLATSRADTALRLLMEVRNKFLDAYQALSRITG